MARWDEILSLPVQNPPTLEFSADDLVWSKVEGWRDNIDRLALIPFARVDDFVRGESSNKDCPTRFHVEARRRRPPEIAYKPKVDGILEYILYWCSFGPDDHRKGGIVRPSRSTYVPKKKSAGRPNTKRGCTCHFIVKRLIAEPSVALIIYNQDKHVDKKGLPCHGPQDKKAAGTRAMYAPYISEDLRLRVLSLLYVGVSVETIMQRHNESVEKQGGPCNRDDLLTHRYVRRQERSIRRSTYELDADDAVSISMWVENHQNNVFFYEDFSDSDPFVLGIQTEWQLQQMIRFGNRSLLASDSRFGTNKLKYPIHSLLVFNSDNKAIPVAWIIAPRFACGDTHRWMRALYNRVHTKDPMWKLAGFIVDDPLADILTIREVFQCSVLISYWRVRHAWHKNLMKTCSKFEMRVEISRQLGQAVNSICRGHGAVDLFEDFMEDFIDGSGFVDYFKAIWYPRIGSWTTALKTLPVASQESCAALEFYHIQMKIRLLNEKDSGDYQRADWLVDKLATKVHSYFWLDEYSGKDDFARYWKDEWTSGLTSWCRSLRIPDSDVVMEGKCAKVTDQADRDRAYVVYNPGSEFAICDCSWAETGNLCEHVFKVIKVYRGKGLSLPSITMVQYNQALIKMLRCPPHDSLIRDHAVSLAAWVEKQLDTMVDLESGETIVDPPEQQTVEIVAANQEKEKMNENISRSAKNGFGVLGDNLVDQVASEIGIGSERDGTELPCAEMEVDPESICTSSAGLFSVDGVVSANVFMKNGEKVLVDAGTDIIEGLPSTDDSFTNLNGFEDDILDNDSTENAMDIDSQFVQTTVSQDRCRIHSKDEEPSSVPHVAQVDPKIDGTGGSVSLDSLPSDSQLVNTVEDAGGIAQNEAIGQQNESGSMSQNLLSADDEVPLAKLRNRTAEDSDLVHNGEEVAISLRIDSTSTAVSVSNDTQLVNMVENAGGIDENLGRSPQNSTSPVDDAVPLAGVHNSTTENSNLGHDAK
ncbi:GPI-anchored adhesin-like protein precursor [Actinidia chinensis var. chinensis]|uniref:GPI-anchored adhesin-like protein n=1 Tax=Actinidia chinensis var. chinensis TaxID=1590841 RepID=A0A2R6S0Y7_ACTCC|nr:GPI-anchored adhesin-like protein precursor [Actinidia chinensis var. chinensis]